MSARCVLADVNVWVATLLDTHPHHPAAVQWWRGLPAGAAVGFCRLTQLVLLRLLCNPEVMGSVARLPPEAWSDYQALLARPAVQYLPEPQGIDRILAAHARLGLNSRGFWADAYLAAFAEAAELDLVTFDRGFRRFPRLSLTLLG